MISELIDDEFAKVSVALGLPPAQLNNESFRRSFLNEIPIDFINKYRLVSLDKAISYIHIHYLEDIRNDKLFNICNDGCY